MLSEPTAHSKYNLETRFVPWKLKYKFLILNEPYFESRDDESVSSDNMKRSLFIIRISVNCGVRVVDIQTRFHPSSRCCPLSEDFPLLCKCVSIIVTMMLVTVRLSVYPLRIWIIIHFTACPEDNYYPHDFPSYRTNESASHYISCL